MERMVEESADGKPTKQVGMFIRNFLRESGESYASKIHRLYKKSFEGWTSNRRSKYRPGTYNSFASYVSKLILMGLIERTGESEESRHPLAEALEYPEVVYLRLTDKGDSAPDYVWLHPLRLWYRPFDWEVEIYGDYIRPKSPARKV